MLSRRGFLGLLAGLPLLGRLKPAAPAPVPLPTRLPDYNLPRDWEFYVYYTPIRFKPNREPPPRTCL